MENIYGLTMEWVFCKLVLFGIRESTGDLETLNLPIACGTCSRIEPGTGFRPCQWVQPGLIISNSFTSIISSKKGYQNHQEPGPPYIFYLLLMTTSNRPDFPLKLHEQDLLRYSYWKNESLWQTKDFYQNHLQPARNEILSFFPL